MKAILLRWRNACLCPPDGRSWRRLLFPALLLLALLLAAGPLFTWVRSHTAWAEWYGQHIYPGFTAFCSRFWGLFPFSAAEFLIFALSIVCITGLVYVLAVGIRKGCLLYRLFAFLLSVGLLAAGIWVSYDYGWAVLYQREPLANRLGLTVKKSTVEELTDLCRALIAETNALRETLPKDETGCLSTEMGQRELLASLSSLYEGMEGLAFLGGEGWCAPKPVALSRQMSRREIVGIYIWLTTEPNVDVDIPVTNLPFNALHEIAHQRGYAREDEANYLAYRACMASENPVVRYSGYCNALVYAMNKLYAADRDAFYTLRVTYGEGLNLDLQRESAYWMPYRDTAVSRVAEANNNNYLKANQQSDGTASYGRMVDLLLAERRTRLAGQS